MNIVPALARRVATDVLLAIVVAQLVRFGAQIVYPPGRVMGDCAITNRIRELRSGHGEMTQQALADRIGVTRQTVNAIELGLAKEALEAKRGAE